jgi:glutamyl-tRNA synthetase
MLRVRFAPSPTGYLHIGSARTYVFNWLYARRHGGTVILRIDDTDVERNTQASLDSIFDGLGWLELGWDELYRQSERMSLYRQMTDAILEKGMATAISPRRGWPRKRARKAGLAVQCRHAGTDAGGERPPRRCRGTVCGAIPGAPETRSAVEFRDAVFGPQSKATADIEDFALMRSNGMPTYHLASCADDIDLRISHVIRGQDHLTNTFKHVLLFEAAGAAAPEFAHLPLLLAPDGAKLSKRKHGPVVSVTTYREEGFLPHAFVNFLCLLGWSPKDDRERMSREELTAAFGFEGINKSNAVVNFTVEDPFDPKAVWLNAEHIRALGVEELATRLAPYLEAAGYRFDRSKLLAVIPLIRERIKTLKEAVAVADFFFLEELPPYDGTELIPQKGDRQLAVRILEHAGPLLEAAEFRREAIEAALRGGAEALGVKPGQMFQPIRVAVCGRKNAPPLFETLEVVGKQACLHRIGQAIARLQS